MEISTVVLHIGSGKTGCSTIQNALFKSGFPGYIFLDGNRGNQKFRFAFCSLSQTTSNIQLKFEGDPNGFLQFQLRIKEEFRSLVENQELVIISSEFLFLSNEKEINDIIIFLKSCGFKRFIGICYLRDPADYYISAAQQSLKSGPQIPDPKKFIYDLESPCRWKTGGVEEFYVREFDRSKLLCGDIIKDFSEILHCVGFNVRLPDFPSTNLSMTVEAAQAVQDLNRAFSHGEKKPKEIRRDYYLGIRAFSMRPRSGNKPELNPKIREYILHKHNEKIDAVKESFGIFESKTISKDIVKLPEVKNFSDPCIEFSLDAYAECARELFDTIDEKLS